MPFILFNLKSLKVSRFKFYAVWNTLSIKGSMVEVSFIRISCFPLNKLLLYISWKDKKIFVILDFYQHFLKFRTLSHLWKKDSYKLICTGFQINWIKKYKKYSYLLILILISFCYMFLIISVNYIVLVFSNYWF